jgi:uncharacterized protein (TIGR02246 family)
MKTIAEDETAIRELVDTWDIAAANKDLDTMLSMLADDVVFLTVGEKPFGKKEFADRFKSVAVRVDARSDIEEVMVEGDLAVLRNHLKVTMTPTAGGQDTTREGYALTVFRREPNRRWVLARDANLLP